MSAIDSALATIDQIGAEGEMDADAPAAGQLRPGRGGRPDPASRRSSDRIHADAVRRADRRPRVQLIDENPAGQPVPSADRPARTRQVGRLPGRSPSGSGESADVRSKSATGTPFYGFVEMQGGPSSDEYSRSATSSCPRPSAAGVRIRSKTRRSSTAMREGWLVMVDEANAARERALLSINAASTGRPSALTSGDGRDVIGRPRVVLRDSRTTRAWSAPPTFPTPGAPGSRPRSR